MVLGKLPVPGRPTIWITVVQGPTALAVGAGGGCLDILLLSILSLLRVGVVWTFYSYLSFLSSFSLSSGDGPI